MRRTITSALALAVLAAACSTAAPGTTSTASTAAPATPGTGTPAAGTSAVATPAGTGPVMPTLDPAVFHAFPDLEAQLPNEVAGVPLQKLSFGAFGGGSVDPLFAAVLAQVGKTVDDVQSAVAGPVDSMQDRELTIIAFRIVGIQGAQLLQAVRTAAQSDPTAGTVADATVGGKQVVALTDADETSYAYAAGEVVYVVSGEPALTDATMGMLP